MGDATNIIVGGASMVIDSSDIGYIVDGVALLTEADMQYFEVEGIPTPVAARRKAKYKAQTTLVEPTMANLKIANDWQNTEGILDPIVLDFGGENFIPTEVEIEIYGYVPGGDLYTRMFTFDSAVAEPGGEVKHTDADMTKVAVTFAALWNATNSRCGTLSDASS